MGRLLSFIFDNRFFFTFITLEILCTLLIVGNNQYQGIQYFNASNEAAARLQNFSQQVGDYLSLREVNTRLAEENAMLRKKLEQRNQSLYVPEVREITDPALINRFDFVSAKVISNSVEFFRNYITINKGSLDSITPGMAVISDAGVVGKVKSVSPHFAVLISLLNIDENVSSVIKRTGHACTARWSGDDARYVNLLFVPRHVKPMTGDTVLTSGYNAIFPAGVMVGIVREVNLRDESLWYDIRVELAQDFRKLSFVDVVRSNLRHESDSLEQTLTDIRK
ncbi:MAG: rod shape-determining protein MreC [Cyclobacteriaceae bacterium]|nr:rod shape-determining protein MreC [Cyclobacteriaceae bacterium]